MNEKYNLVDTVDKLKQLDAILMDGSKAKYPILAYDTETNGLQIYKTVVVGFSISFNQHQGFYVPLLKWVVDPKSFRVRSYKKVKYDAHMKGHLECIWTGEKFDEFVTPDEYNLKQRFPLIPNLLERWLTNTNLYMWNAPFDVNQTFINAGVETKNNLFLDGGLLVHALDENYSVALKPNAEKYKDYLGINPFAHAAMEKKELNESIIRNGGTPGQVWRADLWPQAKYACADTMFTFGICEAALGEFQREYGERGMNWFFNQEVMPVCKEVVIDMKRRGAYVDVPYFTKLHNETQAKMNSLEDSLIDEFNKNGWLDNFTIGESMEDAVKKPTLVKEIIKLEGLKIPQVLDKKTGEMKDSIAKGAVKKEFQKNPHWIWGVILGEDEIKYSDEKLEEVKKTIYMRKINRRHRFNIGSGDHLRWLFCTVLGMNNAKLPQTDKATKEEPKASMAAEVIETHMLPKFPWVQKYLSWKKLQKMQTTYIGPVLDMNIDGWMYVDWKQNGTISGRFSCSGGYNLQTLPRVDDEMEILEACENCHADTYDKDENLTGNVQIIQEVECMADMKCNKCGHEKKDIPRPSAIKQGFIAPPGYKIINADYSSLEPRCFAVMSNETKIKEVYWNDLDLYSKAYCDMFPDGDQYSADPKAPNFLKKVAKAKRKLVKPIVLGIPYGAQDDQVASLIGAKTEKKNYKGQIVLDDDGKPVMVSDTKEGKKMRDLFLRTYPDLEQYMDDQDLKATTYGYVETIVGRRRHFPFLPSIIKVLNKYEIDYKDILDAPMWELKKGLTIGYTSFRGTKVRLSEEMAKEIQELIGFGDEKFKEKGNWSFIRSMLKNDLNGAKNTPIQGLAGHITNKGMLDTTRSYRANNMDAWVALQVHDEITAYAPDEQAEFGSGLMKKGMEDNEFTALLDVPMIAEPIVCNNLKESK